MIQSLDSIGFPWKVRHVKGWEDEHMALHPALFQGNSLAQVLQPSHSTNLPSIFLLPRA